jgi:hypothetical protein
VNKLRKFAIACAYRQHAAAGSLRLRELRIVVPNSGKPEFGSEGTALRLLIPGERNLALETRCSHVVGFIMSRISTVRIRSKRIAAIATVVVLRAALGGMTLAHSTTQQTLPPALALLTCVSAGAVIGSICPLKDRWTKGQYALPGACALLGTASLRWEPTAVDQR